MTLWGEPLSQPYFSRCLPQQTEREGIDTVVETTFTETGDIDSMLHHVSVAYVDLEDHEPGGTQKYCGVDNKKNPGKSEADK